MEGKEVYYSDYLQLDKILEAQLPESRLNGNEAHDEMLFIIVHQAYELWFKQIIHEINSIIDLLSTDTINDNSPALHSVVHRMNRVVEILKLLVQQINTIETMTPLDFLDFRNQLRPASGFQSYQFKMIEAALGLRFDERHAQGYYVSMLRDEHIKLIKNVEDQQSILDLINSWLERMPFFETARFWENFQSASGEKLMDHFFWGDYRQAYDHSLVEGEKDNLKEFDRMFLKGGSEDGRLSAKACRAALFIKLYRDFPLLQNPYRLMNLTLEIDELLANWRYRHMNMVRRMIGSRIGTGGSSGKDYLKAAMDKHYIFTSIAELSSFLIERKNIPRLSRELESKLGFEEV